MADEKLHPGPGKEKIPEAPQPVTADQPQAPAPEQAAAPAPTQEQAGPAKPDPGDVVVSFEQINELMGEKRQAARAEVEKAEAAKAAKEEIPAAGSDGKQKTRRGRPPKEEKAKPAEKEAAKPRKGRPPKSDKAAPGEAQPPKPRDKVVCPPSSRQRNNLHFTHEISAYQPYRAGTGLYA
ncbi:MAG: hypothetical protein E7G07_12735, partial [Flavonifractor plautii]|nr:hypothetical protein [Flavonifractor plautii]